MKEVQKILAKSTKDFAGFDEIRRVVDQQVELAEKNRILMQKKEESDYQILVCGEVDDNELALESKGQLKSTQSEKENEDEYTTPIKQNTKTIFTVVKK